jgi:Domain of unknown function (DUF5666)
MKFRVSALLFCVLLLAIVSFAHGGEEHVMGEVTAISSDAVTVRTTANTVVTVSIAAETEFTKGNSHATIADLKTRDRVVIHAKKEGNRLVAHTVHLAP